MLDSENTQKKINLKPEKIIFFKHGCTIIKNKRSINYHKNNH
jgi:hypothetical protein